MDCCDWCWTIAIGMGLSESVPDGKAWIGYLADGSREESSAVRVMGIGIEDIGYSDWIERIGCRGVVDCAVGLIVCMCGLVVVW